jgi:plastocyanin
LNKWLVLSAFAAFAGIWPSVVLAAAPASGVVVYAGPNLASPPRGLTQQADALAFYPKVATVHVGDAVTWQFRGFHTVTFAGPKQPYPFIVPLGGKQPPAKDAASQPFWWAGAAPVLGISPLSLLLEGGATIASPGEVRSSGLLRIFQSTRKRPPAPYVLTFTKPGTYKYECVVHPAMRGLVRVLPSSSAVPSAATQAEVGAAQVKRTVSEARLLDRVKPAAKLRVFVGAGDRSTGAEIASFFPGSLVIKAGDTVTFGNHDQTDIHTVTFGPAKLRLAIENNFVAPHGKRVLVDPLGAFASEPPGSPTPTYDGANHGNGYLNSGLLLPRGSPAGAGPQSFRVTFSQPGTYHYECVIHSHMDGTIIVH